MDSDLQAAVKKAGVKLGGGLLALTAILAIRVVTATPEGVESEIAELEAAAKEIAAEDAAGTQDHDSAVDSTAPDAEDASLVSRLREKAPGKRPATAGSGAEDADRLVSCNLGGGVQFMRAADCATRGGTSTDFD